MARIRPADGQVAGGTADVGAAVQRQMDHGRRAVPSGGELQPFAHQAALALPAQAGTGNLRHADDPVIQLYLEFGQHGRLNVPDDLLWTAGLIGEDVDLAHRAVFQGELGAEHARKPLDQSLPDVGLQYMIQKSSLLAEVKEW